LGNALVGQGGGFGRQGGVLEVFGVGFGCVFGQIEGRDIPVFGDLYTDLRAQGGPL
jgi:hypothetical protein